MNLYHLFARSIADLKDSPALIDQGGVTVTFGELDARVAHTVTLLAQHGITRGSTVLMLQPMGIEMYVVLLAVIRAGAMAMFFDPSAGRAHIARCCARRMPDAIAAGWKGHTLRLVSPSLRRIRTKLAFGRVPFCDASFHQSAELAPTTLITDVPDTAPALITFTSGSTGVPKAAVRTHGLLRAQYERLVGAIDLAPGQRDLTTLPVFVLANLAAGVTSLLPGSKTAHRERKPDRTVISPTNLGFLAFLTAPTLRRIYTGGGPVYLDLLDLFAKSFPAARVTVLYGSTEAEPIAHVHADALDESDREAMRNAGGLCVGAPIERIALRVIADVFGTPIAPMTARELDSRTMPARAIGEIVVSGDHVLPGYLDGVGDDETKFRVDGVVWHRTGDSGYLDERGRLWLTGRCAARIDDEHGRTYTLPVECAARARLGGRTAYVLHRGRRILLATSHGESVDAEGLRREIPWVHIDDVRIVRQVPYDARHQAKIDYLALRRMLDRGSR
ncbi:MAG: AMP-binding protein [Phycisphaerae bacterium]|mgnify:CR=1 FL=1|nr:AMP-binding protein [Phycisphaerae bacterium]